MKKIIFVFVVVSLLLIVGCTGGSRDKSPITDVDVRKGTDGLTMEFTKNAPPLRVFEDSIFPIAVILKNRGATDIEPVDVEYIESEEGYASEDEQPSKPVKRIKTVKGSLVFGFETTFVDLSEKVKERSLESEKNSLENERSQLKDKKRILENEMNFILEEPGTGDVDSRFNEIDEELSGIKVRNDEINDRIIEISVEVIDVRKKLNLIENDLLDEIKGKSIFSPNGDQELITINAQTKKIGAQSETRPSTILATACYPYKTIFGASVCIDTDIYGERRGKKVCSITDLRFGEGQGAPVAITKIETRMLPLPEDSNLVKPHFLIHIENKGNGEVVELSKVEQACTSERLDYRSFNTIIIKASLSGKPLDCRIKKEGPKAEPPPPAPTTIRLRDKENLVRCTLELIPGEVDELIDINRDAYIAPLSIELEYGYTFTISKDIIIEKILTY
ncbi:MAG: hypothetical protein IH934_02085 [Nanoarchaeota archaeon]|nr:hypothetical protein [Nanoarchaeota archaeon]